MREFARITRIMILIEEIWSKYPDMRFGQLYENLISVYMNRNGYNRISIWMIEDSDFEEFLKTFNGFGQMRGEET